MLDMAIKKAAHRTKMEMEDTKKLSSHKAHCLVLSYPTQGHINPMQQFSKRLQNKGLKVTLVITRSVTKTIHRLSSSSIALETISDGYDEGRPAGSENIQAYLDRFSQVGSQTLAELVEKLNASSGCPLSCIVYDSFLPWALDVAKEFGLVGASFFTQSCAVDSTYYHIHKGLLKLPLTGPEVLLPGLPPLEPQDMPSFISDLGSYPAFFKMAVHDQFANIERADWVLCNTFYELEKREADYLGKLWPIKLIGPTIPSMFLDKQLEDDKDYGFSIFKPNSDPCSNWLKDKPKGSVVYVSFGSLAELECDQMNELALGLKKSNSYFLWVVRASEEEKLPKNFVETSERGLIVSWCPQLEVLANQAVGCFITHCGWNSTLEALSLGVPMVGMPQWTDQSTNAKYIMDVWKMGLKAAANEKGIVESKTIEKCIREIMEGERGKEIKENSEKWKNLARNAMVVGGSSDQNIEQFIASLVHPQ